MTENHGYNTPSKGTQDWHTPLNQNFKHLDRDVEIRDLEANLATYTPKDGALFRATDTGNVYLADGTEWTQHNPPTPTQPSTTDTANGTLVAAPGNVQSVIDQAATTQDFGNGVHQTVQLQSGTVYTPGTTWNVKRGVILDFNGAKVTPTHANDVLHLWPEAELQRPFIDLRETNFSATAITLDGQFDGQYSGPNHARIEDLRLLASPGQGTGIQLRDPGTQNVSDNYISGHIQGFDTSIHLTATGGQQAFVNSNHFDVKVMNFRVGIKQEAVNGAAANGNVFRVNTQPLSGTTNWLWDIGSNVGFNVCYASPWDAHMYQNQTVWRIRSGATGQNTLVDHYRVLGADNIVNHADGSNTLSHP